MPADFARIANLLERDLRDNQSIFWGSDRDIPIVQTSAGVAADTAFTDVDGRDVLVGTVVSQAIAANSLIISNITASGDLALYGNRGGNSEQFLFMDVSAGVLYLTPYAGGLMLGFTVDPPAPDNVNSLHLWAGSAGAVSAGAGAMLILENSSANTNIQFLTPNSGSGGTIAWGDPESNIAGWIDYDHSSDVMDFRAAAGTRMQLGSSGLRIFESLFWSDATNGSIYTDSLGVARNITYDITIGAGGAANAVVQHRLMLDSVIESGLLGETDGTGSYTQAKTIWKVPYRDSGANVAAPTDPTTAATWLGGIRVEAGDDFNRIYFYVNEAWHYINQTA